MVIQPSPHDATPLQAFNMSVDPVTHFSRVVVLSRDNVLSAQLHIRTTKGSQPSHHRPFHRRLVLLIEGPIGMEDFDKGIKERWWCDWCSGWEFIRQRNHASPRSRGIKLRMPPSFRYWGIQSTRMVFDDLRSFCHFEGEIFLLGVRRFNFLNLLTANNGGRGAPGPESRGYYHGS